MADTNETIDDIIAEKRRRAADIRRNLSTVPIRRDEQLAEAECLEDEADRLEAAHKRERGDCAKLREAVIGLRDRISMFYKNEWIPYDEWEGANDDAKAALAAPPRNCNIGTAKEQAERWYWFYHVGHLCQSCPLGPRKWSEVDAIVLCFSEWLQTPYVEQKGENNGR